MDITLTFRANGGNPDSNVHGANTGPIWGWQDSGGSHVGPMNLAIWETTRYECGNFDSFAKWYNTFIVNGSWCCYWILHQTGLHTNICLSHIVNITPPDDLTMQGVKALADIKLTIFTWILNCWHGIVHLIFSLDDMYFIWINLEWVYIHGIVKNCEKHDDVLSFFNNTFCITIPGLSALRIHWWQVDYLHKGPVMQCFDVFVFYPE